MLKAINSSASFSLLPITVAATLVVGAGPAAALQTTSLAQRADTTHRETLGAALQAVASSAKPTPKEAKTSDKSAASQLKLGDVYLKAGEWDEAIKAYVKAAESESESVARKAREGLAKALKDRESSPLGLRAYLPAPFDHWRPIDYAVYAAIAVVAFFTIAPLLHAFVFRVVGPFVRWILKGDRTRADWRVSISGTAEEPYRSMAFDEFMVTMRELSDHDRTASELTAVGKSGGRLFTPIPLSDFVGPGLVVQGIDLSQLAKAVQAALDHFSYRFEVRIDENGGSAYVYAHLSWGGMTEKTWQIPPLGDDAKLKYREIGRQLAYTVFGDSLIRQ